MVEIKSCENCGWNGAWKDGNGCPFYNVNMCDSKRLKMWARRTANDDEPKPNFIPEHFNEFVAPRVMTNKEAAAVLSSMLDNILCYSIQPRGNGKTLLLLRREAMCKAIKVLEETPD